jgi:hypothetical protein
MPRTLEVQSTFSSGEAEPRLLERRDVQFYYAAVERGRNIVALPQGGFAASPGLASESPLRNPVSAASLAGASASAPNGGTAANALDGNPANVLTTSAVSGATFVALALDLGAPLTFCAVDVLDFSAGTAAIDQCLAVQYSLNNSDWTTVQLMDLDTAARSRRFALPPGVAISAQYFRIAVLSGAGAGALTVTDMRILTELDFTGHVRTLNFNFAKGQEYSIALTDGHGDVFLDGVWKAAFAIDTTAAMLPDIEWTSRLDSLLVFHEDLETPLVKRQGRHSEWDFRPYPYTNLPIYDFGGSYVNGVNAKQRVQLFNLTTGEAFDLTLEGETTTSITINATPSVTAASIASALEALPNVVAGMTVTAVSASVFDVTFTGGANAAREWLTMEGTGYDTDGIVVVRQLVRGKPAGEAVISASAGWPRTGVFFKQCLVLAGFRSLPLHIMKSVIGRPHDFNTEISDATGAMLFELDAGTANEIFKLHAGFRLMAFTSDGVYFHDAENLVKTEVPNFISTQQPGIKRGLPVINLEGGLIFIEQAGKIVREMRYSEIAANFEARGISTLSSHLLADPVDMDHRRAVTSADNDMVHIVNTDGTLVFMTALRSENVTGFTLRDSAPGLFKAVTVNSEQAVRVAIARRTAGTDRLWLERFDPDVRTDGAFMAAGSALTQIVVSDAHEGEAMHVFCDDAYVGLRTVTAGVIGNLPASSAIEAGFAALPDVIDMPVLEEEEARQPLARQKRVYMLDLSLYRTEHVAVQVNGGPVYEVPLMQMGETEIGQSMGAAPFTGTVHLEGFPGFTETGQVRILQLRPGRLTVRQIRKSLRV